MHSTLGRPRKLTDAQVEAIMQWHASRKTLAEFSAEIGLPPSLVQYVISRGGQYKQASPERRLEALQARRQQVAKVRRGGWM
ncbi:hypothetical protein [Povalibacter sp.]|uniref:hypothetical protein n=1 Tax=Povalibacter sp. TaxID=1962978 RepID=UPI002F41C67E